LVAGRDGQRFVVHAEELLTAFWKLEAAICACGELPRQAGESFPNLTGYETSNQFKQPQKLSGLFIPLILLCFALSQSAQGVVPPPDGCYPNNTTGGRMQSASEPYHRS
jgi:hypothetical protein